MLTEYMICIWIEGSNLYFRWSVDGASIFSVADGKRLAQEPPRLPTAFEAARMNRVSKAALDTPLLNGYRQAPSPR